MLAVAAHEAGEGFVREVEDLAVGEGKGADFGGGFVGLGVCDGDFGVGEGLDGRFADVEEVDKVLLPARMQHNDSQPAPSSAARATRAVDVGLGVLRGVLDDEVDLGDVEAAGGDVCADEDGGAGGGEEAGEVLVAGLWAEFAVEGD